MKARLLSLLASIRSSYWFIPTLMALAAVVLSTVTTSIDRAIGMDWLEDWNWLYANRPDGARAVLSTVAGSMITVAGVTFSMTILSISYAASQVGPRLLSNFMRDRGNQITLGVFIATFLYCLLVLRTVRNAEALPPGTQLTNVDNPELMAAFVPQIAIMFALFLAVASVGVLIYFIHHIPENLHVSNIVANVGRSLQKDIDERFPKQFGTSPPEPPEDEGARRRTKKEEATPSLPDHYYRDAVRIESHQDGYIRYLDEDGLIEAAREHDLLLRLRFRPGDFVTQGKTLLHASPAERVTEKVADSLRHTFVVGMQRSREQNLQFLFDQLVEVSMRALSPGINDPFTAMNCMDWLRAALRSLAERDPAAAFRFDKEKNLRVVAEPLGFEAYAGMVFDQMRPYVAADRNASIHMMEMLAKLAVDAPKESQRRLLVRHATALLRHSRALQEEKRDLDLLRRRYKDLLKMLRDEDYRRELIREGTWIGGRA